MTEKEPTYKEKNGTTRVGDFLRSIGKSQVFESAVKIATNSGGGILDVLKDVLFESKELTKSQQDYALKMLEFDMQEAKEVSNRWQSDMITDSWLSKNVRPLILIYSWLLISVMIFTGSDFIQTEYIDMIKILALTVNTGYFGGRIWREQNLINQQKK